MSSLLLLLSISPGLLHACTALPQTPSEELAIRLYADQTSFLVGEPIRLVVILENTGRRPLRLPGFSFTNPGNWEQILVSVDGLSYSEAPSPYGGGRELSLSTLLPGETLGFEFNLHELATPLQRDVTYQVRAEVNLRDGVVSETVVDSNGNPRPEEISLAFAGKISSNTITLSITSPSEPEDVAAYNLLLARLSESKGPFARVLTDPPIFQECIQDEANSLMRDYPLSRYSIHARYYMCLEAIAKQVRTQPSLVLSTIVDHRLGALEDDALLYATVKMLIDSRVNSADRDAVLQRLKTENSNRGGNLIAKSLGYIR